MFSLLRSAGEPPCWPAATITKWLMDCDVMPEDYNEEEEGPFTADYTKLDFSNCLPSHPALIWREFPGMKNTAQQQQGDQATGK